MNTETILFMLTIAGGNRTVPQNIKDLKVAELPWSERLENAYIDIQKGFQGLNNKEILTMMERMIIDYSTAGNNIKLLNFINETMKSMLEYLSIHEDERVRDTQEIADSISDLINEEL